MQLISPGVLSVFLHDVLQDHYGKHQRPGFELSKCWPCGILQTIAVDFPKQMSLVQDILIIIHFLL